LHRSIPLNRGLAFGIGIALLVAACGSGSQAAGGNADQPATIGFAAPTDGAQVTVPFDVQLEASVPLGEPETGNHHAHLYFDTDTDSAEYDIVYGNTAQVTRPLAPGQHTIIVALANPDHSLAGPTQTITVTVGETGGSGGSGGTEGSPSPVAAPSEPAPTY
jgi:hypothetical protein